MVNLTKENFVKIKEIELKIMNEIHKICVSNNIPYTLFSGTLIGAVRHNGFIPWDDDIDIMMSEEDYPVFKNACAKSLKKPFFLQDNQTEKDSSLPNAAKIRMEGTCLLERPNIGKNMHHGVWVDIFVYKTFNGDKKIINKGKKMFDTYKIRRDALFLSNKSFKGKIASILFVLAHPFSPSYYKKKYDYYFHSLRCKGEFLLTHDCNPKLMTLKAKYLKDVTLHKFENYNFYIMKEYDLALTLLYGDYMKLPEEKDRVPNHQFVKVEL